jgi:PTS system N-acetylgalactosamine-specific IIA component
MIGILVTGHGKFASGLLSSLKLIAGEQENIIGIDFLEEHGTEMLLGNLKDAIESLGDKVLVLADLAGGSPYMNAVIIKLEMKNKEVEVISGANLPMLLEIALGKSETNILDLAKNAEIAGKNSIGIFKFEDKKDEIIEDGI